MQQSSPGNNITIELVVLGSSDKEEIVEENRNNANDQRQMVLPVPHSKNLSSGHPTSSYYNFPTLYSTKWKGKKLWVENGAF